MGVSEWAFQGEEIPSEVIRRHSKGKYDILEQKLEELGTDMEGYTRRVAYDDPDELWYSADAPKDDAVLAELDSLYDDIIEAFEEFSGIEVALEYPSGDTDDEAKRPYWVAQNLYIKNPDVKEEAWDLLREYEVICTG